MKHLLYYFLMFLIVLSFSSCGQLLHTPRVSKARLGEVTSTTENLRNLPPPKEKIVVAVYKFRDQTGQYKPSENGNSFSTAVTQGATTVLIKALEDSNWFVPIERENVGNLLNERKIIRSSRTQFNKDEGNQSLPPLLYAGVILEGGIISYDANVLTGGAGLRYFGTGAGAQYRQDRVTVYLRAVSTSNGKVLKTVYTSKMILSQSLDGGLFRFVQFGRLLEAEMGFTYNEPSEIAVTEAIEKAVQSLIIEGVFDELWQLKEPRMIVDDEILAYKKEKEMIPQTDIFGSQLENRRSSIALSARSTTLQYRGDFPQPTLETGFEAGITYTKNPSFGLGFSLGMARLATEQFYDSGVTYADLDLKYRLLPYDRLSPLINAGGGLITNNIDSRFDFSNRIFPKLHAGAGLEYLVNDNIGFEANLNYNFTFSDELDAIQHGKYNDFYWRANLGVNFYLGKPTSSRNFNFNKSNNGF